MNVQVEKVSDFNFAVFGAGQGKTDRFDLVLATLHPILDLKNVEIFIRGQHLKSKVTIHTFKHPNKHIRTHPFLVVVVTEAGVLKLLHQLVLLLLTLGEPGQDLPHGGDGESVGLGHGDGLQRNETPV